MAVVHDTLTLAALLIGINIYCMMSIVKWKLINESIIRKFSFYNDLHLFNTQPRLPNHLLNVPQTTEL